MRPSMPAASLPAKPPARRFPRQRRYRVYWIAVSLLWLGWIALVYWFGRYGSWQHGDFDVYYEAARYFAQGVSPYFGTTGQYYLYPPLLGQLLMPLASLDLLTVWHIWFGLNMLVLIGTLYLFSRYLSPATARLLWLTPLVFEPILDSFYVGQVTIIILALVTGAWAARREGHPLLAGALIALAAWLKVYPGLILLFFLWKRDWRVVGGIVGAGLALAALQILLSGTQIFSDSFGVIFNLAGSGQTDRITMNVSILGFTSQVFIGNQYVTPLVSSLALHLLSRLALTAVVVITLGYLTITRLRLPDQGQQSGETFDLARFDLEYCLALMTAMLLSPTLWASGMPLLLLCFWLLWRAGGRIERYLIAFVLVVLTVHSWFMMGYIGMGVLPALVLSFGFYAVATLWGVNVALLAREKRKQT